jgi:hypothetical protein
LQTLCSDYAPATVENDFDLDLGFEQATEWAALYGKWEFADSDAEYVEPQDPSVPLGLAITNVRLRQGWVRTTVTLDDVTTAGRIVFGHDPGSSTYFSVGVGGDRFAYYLDQFVPGTGWQPIAGRGVNTNLAADTPYALEVSVGAQSATLEVDGIVVLSAELPTPIFANQVGVIAWGAHHVRFSDFRALPQAPEAFVVMQYGDPYDAIYSEVIQPVGSEMGYFVRRADDVYVPGIVLQDIIRSLTEAAVVIAEITPANANVFYELGYAHALGKPTILLAERGRELPFDVSGYRCIFYDNTIAGKQAVDNDLRRHLIAVA